MTYYILFAILLLGGAYCAVHISIADWRRRIIPDVYLFPLVLIGLVLAAYFPWVTTPGESAIAGIFGYILGFATGWMFEKMAKKKKTGGKATDYPPIGLGDVKLLAAGGIWLGTTGLAIAIVAACALGGIWGLRRKEKYIPFAPFFMAGAIIALTVLWFTGIIKG